jgi:hypothetical protein
MKEEEMK